MTTTGTNSGKQQNHGAHPISLGSPLRFEPFQTKPPAPEPECEQWVTFQVRVKGYGRREKLRHDIALRLCRNLFQLFGIFEVKILDSGGINQVRNVKYNPDGEGGTVTFE